MAMDESADAPCEAPTPASRGKRFLNLVVDLLGFYAFLTAILFAIGSAAPHFMERWKTEQGLAFATNLAIFFFYYVGCEALTLRSPGKLLTRTRVVAFDGGIPSFGQIALRTLLRQLPLEWLPLLMTDEAGAARLPLHDQWSGTLVAEIPKPEV
jgi:uncharacterized RDD family membrane protein YckC